MTLYSFTNQLFTFNYYVNKDKEHDVRNISIIILIVKPCNIFLKHIVTTILLRFFIPGTSP